jgi:hypothetical protein
MDSFKIHGQVIGDYRGYIESFIQIRDGAIRAVVDGCQRGGQVYWILVRLGGSPGYAMAVRACSGAYPL